MYGGNCFYMAININKGDCPESAQDGHVAAGEEMANLTSTAKLLGGRKESEEPQPVASRPRQR